MRWMGCGEDVQGGGGSWEDGAQVCGRFKDGEDQCQGGEVEGVEDEAVDGAGDHHRVALDLLCAVDGVGGDVGAEGVEGLAGLLLAGGDPVAGEVPVGCAGEDPIAPQK